MKKNKLRILCPNGHLGFAPTKMGILDSPPQKKEASNSVPKQNLIIIAVIPAVMILDQVLWATMIVSAPGPGRNMTSSSCFWHQENRMYQ